MLQRHQCVVATGIRQRSETIDPFAAECQRKLASLGGWAASGICLKPGQPSDAVRVTQSFVLPNSSSRFPVAVLDGVLPGDMCQALIDVHEKVGFETPPSLLMKVAKQTMIEGEDEDADQLMQLAYEQEKNTSQLVQIKSSDFADYLWERLRQYFPPELPYDPAEFEGGKLNFVKLRVDEANSKIYESQATVAPAVGRCVLFRHDELHEGGGV
ncbi:unnamed protein product, partial [Symbiodinium pilosum]